MHHFISNTCAIGISQCQNSAFQRVIRRQSMKRSHKKICFNESVHVVQIPERSSDMTREEKSRLYYSKEALMNFQVECREICKNAVSRAFTLSKKKPALSRAKSLSLVLKHDSSLRGFEATLCMNRKVNKKLMLKAVHMYYKNLRNESQLSIQQREEILAAMYYQLSCWSQMLAVLTAQNDAAQAYRQDTEVGTSIVHTSRAPTPISDQPLHLPNVVSPIPKPKRGGAYALADNRRKRRKVTKDTL